MKTFLCAKLKFENGNEKKKFDEEIEETGNEIFCYHILLTNYFELFSELIKIN
jgi:hypothetical protein